MAGIDASANGAAVRTQIPVNIVAGGPTQNNLFIYAVAVSQPVQSWTVLRSHNDFLSLARDLPTPPCPQQSAVMEQSRLELQGWLTTIFLQYPQVSASDAMRNFLTQGANMIPEEYNGVSWISFSAAPVAAMSSPPPTPSVANTPQQPQDMDDMDMDMGYMFMGEEEEAAQETATSQDEDDVIPPASERYKPTDEAVADEDEMDMLQYAGEVEMIEDIGSLAKSMGASYLGRSLQLQAEMKIPAQHQKQQNVQSGIQIGGKTTDGPTSSGIGSAMAHAMSHAPPSHQMGTPTPAPVSAPRLDSFKMVKVIGKGSFGKVFLVRENKSGEMYALKVLRKDNIIKRNQIEHTKTERSVLGYVKHPFIVGLNMAFQSKDKLYFVLDYCAGGELFFHLGKLGRFPQDRARFYAAEIVLAISYVHSLDIVYRDLKPENVLLDHLGHIRLTDFGLSKEGISSSSSGANSFCGTPEYLAPEILNRQGHGRAVDWWSLGALLYEMLSGLPPFYCQDREKLFHKIRHSELPYPNTVKPEAKELLVGLLTKDPNRRLGSGPGDAEDIKVKSFFAPINWEKLFNHEIEPPWVPKIQSKSDTSQFDKEFTNMPVFSPQSMQRGGHPFLHGTTPMDNNHFEGFTFTDHSAFLGGTRPGAATAGRAGHG